MKILKLNSIKLKFAFLILLTSFYQTLYAQNEIKLTKKNGVYYLPCSINGYKSEFIFDSGASIVSISEKLANKLITLNLLSYNDVKGLGIYQNANGQEVKAQKVILRKINIGEQEISNVEGVIINSQTAPLLLGQTALQKLGNFTFDYDRGYLIFEQKIKISEYYIPPANLDTIYKYKQFFKKIFFDKSLDINLINHYSNLSDLIEKTPEIIDYTRDEYTWKVPNDIEIYSELNGDSTIAYLAITRITKYDIIEGLPFNLSLNKSTIDECLTKFSKYKPELRQNYLDGEPLGKRIYFKYKEYHIYLDFIRSRLESFIVSKFDFDTAG